MHTTETSITNVGQSAYDHVWSGDTPVAQIDATGTHFTFVDHLDAPTIQTDATGANTYQADYEPYGSVYALRGTVNPHQPLRLPGQVAEQFDTGANGATDLSYNNARWYRPTWGRYAQSDPIGLRGGQNVYSYVNDDPLNYADPLGLCKVYVKPLHPLGLPVNHLDIVTVDPNGSETVSNAGPENSFQHLGALSLLGLDQIALERNEQPRSSNRVRLNRGRATQDYQ